MDVWGAITQPTTSIVQEGMATDAKKIVILSGKERHIL